MEAGHPEPSGPTVFDQALTLPAYLDLLAAPGRTGYRPLHALEHFHPRPAPPAEPLPGVRRTLADLYDHEFEVGSALGLAWTRVNAALGRRFGSNALDSGPKYHGFPHPTPADVRLHKPTKKDDVTWEADSRQYVHNLILHAESEDIAVTWGSFPEFLGGFVYRRREGPHMVRRDPNTAPLHVDASELPKVTKADVMLMLNYRQSWASTFDVLIHELAHVLLGHVGAMRGSSEGRLAINPFRSTSKDVNEFEAFSVGHMVSMALGKFSPTLVLNMLPFHKTLKEQAQWDKVDVLEVFIAAEVLCAWCDAPPGRNAVPAGSRSGPPSRPATKLRKT